MDVRTLTKMFKSSPALAQMVQTRHCILVIGSASHSHIDKLLKGKLLPQFYRACDPDQLNLTYLSYNKVDAMQDSLLLASYLYRLQKSIIVTEPSDSIFSNLPSSENQSSMTVVERTKKIFRAGTRELAQLAHSSTLDFNTKTSMQNLMHEG